MSKLYTSKNITTNDTMTSFFFNNHWCKNPTVNSHDWYSNNWIIFTQLVFYTKFCTNLDTKHQISWYDQFYWTMTILLPTKNTPVLIQVPGAPEKFVQSFSIRGVFVVGGWVSLRKKDSPPFTIFESYNKCFLLSLPFFLQQTWPLNLCYISPTW